MSSESEIDTIFKALSHPRRRLMLDRLKDQPHTTGSLCEVFSDMDRCTVMQHLKVLQDADLVIVKREGRERWNYLNSLPIKAINDRWIGAYADHAVRLLGRLKSNLDG